MYFNRSMLVDKSGSVVSGAYGKPGLQLLFRDSVVWR